MITDSHDAALRRGHGLDARTAGIIEMQTASLFIDTHGDALEAEVIIDEHATTMIRSIQGELSSAIDSR